MRNINILSVLVLVFLVGCRQYEFEAEAEDDTKVAEKSIAAVTQAVVGVVSKVTGLGAEENKALSKEDLEKLAGEVKSESEKAKNGSLSTGFASGSRKNGVGFTYSKNGSPTIEERVKKAPELVKSILSSTEKFEEAFKALLGAGYSDSESGKVSSKLEEAKERLSLLDKVVSIGFRDGKLEDNDKKKRDEIKKKLDECTKSYSGFKSSEYTCGTLQYCIQKCMNKFMGDEKKLFEEIAKALTDSSSTAQEKFKKSLEELGGAAKSLSDTACIISVSFQ
ncbi:hypothetical protein DB313_05100 (plasmid) [Borrelia turcica IST7]|uniref:Uncharacterized protein n=1 Tax=Borrelia turcica IST7 TaxID=1104446 RepID=A0A386PQ03_9SPIR|nr:hypothetical protein [Borrelia turcica]AYE36877.1 hypothetical protein DB313_05100 [Borrelia turcica IST7]